MRVHLLVIGGAATTPFAWLLENLLLIHTDRRRTLRMDVVLNVHLLAICPSSGNLSIYWQPEPENGPSTGNPLRGPPREPAADPHGQPEDAPHGRSHPLNPENGPSTGTIKRITVHLLAP